MLYFTLGTIAYPFYYITMIIMGLIGIILSFVVRFFRNMSSFASLCQKYQIYPWQWSKLAKASLLDLQETLKKQQNRNQDNDSK